MSQVIDDSSLLRLLKDAKKKLAAAALLIYDERPLAEPGASTRGTLKSHTPPAQAKERAEVRQKDKQCAQRSPPRSAPFSSQAKQRVGASSDLPNEAVDSQRNELPKLAAGGGAASPPSTLAREYVNTINGQPDELRGFGEAPTEQFH